MTRRTTHFALTPSRQQPRLFLVRSTDAIRLARDGSHQPLSPQQSLSCLLGAAGQLVRDARSFVIAAGLLSRSLADCDDVVLLARLRKLLEVGTLVVVRESDVAPAKETASLVKQRRAVRAVEKGRRSTLKFEGRAYRLVADADLARLPDRDEYTVVEQKEAIRVLDGMARGDAADQADKLAAARKQLTRDWRPPFAPDGIVLLKKIVVPHAVPKSEAALAKAAPSSGGAPEAQPEEKEEPVCRPCADQAQKNQAAVLIQAARQGMPFLELCTRAAASVSAQVSFKASLSLSF